MKRYQKNSALSSLPTRLGFLVLGLGVLPACAQEVELSAADTAWMLVATAMVLFMIPGLALFYGGLARSKNILATMMHSFIALGVITVQWVLYGYSLAFGEGGSYIGDFSHVFLRGINPETLHGTIPKLLFVAFQGTFACITPALIAGAFAERVKLSSYIVFILLWSTLVYNPVAHWVWAEQGFLFRDGAIDFAGGTVVHILSGIAGLVAALILGQRRGLREGATIPHNLVYTVLGAGMLWFGWFGFNAGSALGAGSLAALALINTFVAPAAGMCSWLVVERLHLGKMSALGAASGLVGGLVAITPAAGTLEPLWAMVLGAISSAVCYYFVTLKHKLGYDDSLDVFGIHGVGGVIGALGCGVFASYGVNSLLFTGNPEAMPGWSQFIVQLESVAWTAGYSAIMTGILVFGIQKTIGFRVLPEDEELGLDLTIHGEKAYNIL